MEGKAATLGLAPAAEVVGNVCLYVVYEVLVEFLTRFLVSTLGQLEGELREGL